jgi:hypothetical protein
MESQKMSETATNIVEGFRTLRIFCHELAKMLRTADGMMEEADWTSAGNRAVGSTSKVIGEPDEWLPSQFFRGYENEDYPDFVPFVSVILHDPEVDNETEIDEALISAGYLEFEDGKEVGSLDWAWAFIAHAWMGDEDDTRKDDGTRYSVNPEEVEWDKKAWKGVARVNTFALPLDEITSAAALKEKVIQPLLAMLLQHGSQA